MSNDNIRNAIHRWVDNQGISSRAPLKKELERALKDIDYVNDPSRKNNIIIPLSYDSEIYLEYVHEEEGDEEKYRYYCVYLKFSYSGEKVSIPINNLLNDAFSCTEFSWIKPLKNKLIEVVKKLREHCDNIAKSQSSAKILEQLVINLLKSKRVDDVNLESVVGTNGDVLISKKLFSNLTINAVVKMANYIETTTKFHHAFSQIISTATNIEPRLLKKLKFTITARGSQIITLFNSTHKDVDLNDFTYSPKYSTKIKRINYIELEDRLPDILNELIKRLEYLGFNYGLLKDAYFNNIYDYEYYLCIQLNNNISLGFKPNIKGKRFKMSFGIHNSDKLTFKPITYRGSFNFPNSTSFEESIHFVELFAKHLPPTKYKLLKENSIEPTLKVIAQNILGAEFKKYFEISTFYFQRKCKIYDGIQVDLNFINIFQYLNLIEWLGTHKNLLIKILDIAEEYPDIKINGKDVAE